MEKLDIAELIEELEEYIEECKIVPFSGGKVNIVKNDVMTRLEELKEEIPAEVERSKEIVSIPRRSGCRKPSGKREPYRRRTFLQNMESMCGCAGRSRWKAPLGC